MEGLVLATARPTEVAIIVFKQSTFDLTAAELAISRMDG